MPVGKIKNLFQFRLLIKSVFFKNYFIGVCTFFWVLSSVTINGLEIASKDVIVSLFLGLSTTLMYNLDRLFNDEWHFFKSLMKLKSIPHDANSLKIHAKVRNQLFFLLPIFVLIFLLPSYVFKALLVPSFVAIFYAIPFGKKHLRLREFSLLKIFLIAFVWAFVGAFLTKAGFQKESFILFIQRFFLIYAITLPFDLRDAKLDQRVSLATIPLRIGIRPAIWTGHLAIFSLIATYLLYPLGDMWPRYLSLLAAFLLLLFWNFKRPWYYYLFFLDTCIILDSLAVVNFF